MRIAVFGGDKRMLFAARSFADEGHEVFVAGFDHLLSLCEISICDYEKAARQCDIAVLPVRPVIDGFLNAPFSEHKIGIADLAAMIGNKPVYTGFADSVRPYAAGKVFDYAAEDDFTMRNAELTAEGAVGLLIRDYEGSVFGTKVLVTGFGRIGKLLSAYLKAMGADVTVAARKATDRERIGMCGYTPVDYPNVDFPVYRVIINTVPTMVMDHHAVGRMRDDVFLIELASDPGGFAIQRVRDRDLSYVRASGLPGKTAPLAAGTIIKDTVIRMMNEDGVL